MVDQTGNAGVDASRQGCTSRVMSEPRLSTFGLTVSSVQRLSSTDTCREWWSSSSSSSSSGEGCGVAPPDRLTAGRQRRDRQLPPRPHAATVGEMQGNRHVAAKAHAALSSSFRPASSRRGAVCMPQVCPRKHLLILQQSGNSPPGRAAAVVPTLTPGCHRGISPLPDHGGASGPTFLALKLRCLRVNRECVFRSSKYMSGLQS